MQKYNRIHFIGIGGIGVSGLAEYFLRNGCDVSGSDMNSSHITERLASLGAKIYIGHKDSNIQPDREVVCFSSAINADNPEMLKAKEIGIHTIRRAEMLGEIVNDKFLIAIAGTHGKTTTTAMIGKLLVDAGMDPLIFVGGNVQLFDGGASRFGNGKYAVVEADEYDRSFLALTPDIAVITNIDEDHLDIYEDLKEIINTFGKFCKNSKPDAKIVFWGDDANIIESVAESKRKELSYGFHFNNDIRITDYRIENGMITYSAEESGRHHENMRLNMAGRHNALNSAACLGVSILLDIEYSLFKKSIREFKTVDRRLQLKYEGHGVRVYDDYAHHPKEIESSLKGLKELTHAGRVISVFQPHLFSRTKDFYKDFAEKLAIADKVILMDIYPAREKPIEGVTSQLIFDELKKLSSGAEFVHVRQDIENTLLGDLKIDDLIVFQGAGDVTGLCDDFIKQLKVKLN